VDAWKIVPPGVMIMKNVIFQALNIIRKSPLFYRKHREGMVETPKMMA
jgi:hypothetical protein